MRIGYGEWSRLRLDGGCIPGDFIEEEHDMRLE